MQVILDIEANQKDILMNIINNLKEGIIKSCTIKNTSSDSIENVSSKEELEIKTILDTMSHEDREISSVSKYSVEL